MKLEDVKTGDPIIFQFGDKYVMYHVEKRTPKRILVACREFKVSDGHPVRRQDGGMIHPPTEEVLEKAAEWKKQREQRERQTAHEESIRRQLYKEKCREVSDKIRAAASGEAAALILQNKVWELTN